MSSLRYGELCLSIYMRVHLSDLYIRLQDAVPGVVLAIGHALRKGENPDCIVQHISRDHSNRPVCMALPRPAQRPVYIHMYVLVQWRCSALFLITTYPSQRPQRCVVYVRYETMMGFPRSAGYIPMLLRPLPWDGRKGLLMYIHSILGSKFKT